jgi:hypothetical protein
MCNFYTILSKKINPDKINFSLTLGETSKKSGMLHCAEKICKKDTLRLPLTESKIGTQWIIRPEKCRRLQFSDRLNEQC